MTPRNYFMDTGLPSVNVEIFLFASQEEENSPLDASKP